MNTTASNYQRAKNNNVRGTKMISVDSIDKFPEVLYKNSKVGQEVIAGNTFYSFHEILGTSNQVIMTAYKSQQCPDVLLIVWRDFPYAHHIEQGGDLMIQEIMNNGIKNLLIDNTYVQSGWMNDKINQYFDQIWYPSLIQLGLKGFAHVQALSSLGGASFQKFKENVQIYLNTMAIKMGRKVFTYHPVETKGDVITRLSALNEGYYKLKENN